jgi:hypothetical protein
MNWLTVHAHRYPILGMCTKVRLNLGQVVYVEVADPNPKDPAYRVQLNAWDSHGSFKAYYALPDWKTEDEAQAWIDRIMPSIE